MSAVALGAEQNQWLDTWVSVNQDGTITVRTGKVELGQGVLSAIARIAADELDVALERIRMESADTARGPEEFMTVGSESMEESGTNVRHAAACARAALLERAAAELDAATDDLEVVDGTVTDCTTGRTTTYWQVQGGRAFELSLRADVQPKRPEQHRIVGRPGPRIDLEGIVTGTTRYVQDLAPPGLLHARVLRPPSHSARLTSLDTTRLGDVAVVRDGSFVGVIAEREEAAVRAREILTGRARWSEQPSLPPQHALAQWLLDQPSLDLNVVDGVPVEGEPVPPHEPSGDALHRVEATFTRGYQMHGSIGPSAALAQWQDGALTVWTHSQGVHVLRVSVAEALGVDPAVVRVVHVPGPGCYGHNGADDAALDAALLAREAGARPVLLKWMRDDEHRWEPYGPATVVKTNAGVDANGRIVDWNLEAWSQTHLARPFPAGERSWLLAAWHTEQPMEAPDVEPVLLYHTGIHRNADPLYAVGRRRIVKHLVTAPSVRTSSTRALGAYANVFAIESTMDELAEAAGVDPVEFRLRHLEDERARAVIRTAAEHADWAARPAHEGWGRGIGFAQYKNVAAYAAVIADVIVDDETAVIRVERAVIAADAGEVVDPAGLANQLEGGVVQSTSWTLKEQVSFDSTRVTSVDWETYPILTFAEAPDVETVLLDQPGEPFLGAGEATQGPTAAAIANAVYDAVGIRLRDIPFTPERLRKTALEVS
jgi:CO/xanthine dehydrogenase Mo-binding subunit